MTAGNSHGAGDGGLKPPPAPKKDEPKVSGSAAKNKDCNRVIQYLFSGVVLTINSYRSVFQTVRRGECRLSQCCFYRQRRKRNTEICRPCEALGTFKQDASAATSGIRSDFRKRADGYVHLFEAAIDLLSYATYLKMRGQGLQIGKSAFFRACISQRKKEIERFPKILCFNHSSVNIP